MAIDFMGPPTADLKEGQWKVGYTYHYSENDLLLEDVKIDAVKITRNYATFNYGLVDQRMELYGFIGYADTEIESL